MAGSDINIITVDQLIDRPGCVPIKIDGVATWTKLKNYAWETLSLTTLLYLKRYFTYVNINILIKRDHLLSITSSQY